MGEVPTFFVWRDQMLDKSVLYNVSEKPGVYIFKNGSEYIYIGKAKNLKRRLNSHFSLKEEKSRLIVEESNSLEVIIVKNEKEALLLEATLIFKHKPKYNIMLKEGERYPYIRISDDEYPYVEVTRSRKSSGIFFGPFTNITFTRLLLEILQKIFGVRTCKKDLSKIKKPCIEYHLKTCLAPCKFENKNIYMSAINNLKKVLSGDFEFVKDYIEQKMNYHSKMLDFENAAKYRDLLLSFEKLLNTQGVILNDKRCVDYIAYSKKVFLVLKVRGGVLLSKLFYEANLSFEEFLYQFYYGMKSDLPTKIVTFESSNLNKIEFDIPINVSLDDSDRYLLEIAYENLKEHFKAKRLRRDTLKKIKEILGLKKIPYRIEGTDISHRNGKFTVASLVVFENGVPKPEEYRRYKLGDILDDFESIRMFIRKRYTKHEAPDLIFVDGGRGQVNAAIEAFNELGLDVDVVGIAKKEEIIVTKNKEFKLKENDEVLRTLISIRDETHRVANSFSGSLKLKNYTLSKLDDIPGIGPKRKKILLKKYKSIENIKNAPLEELSKIVGNKIALRLKEYL